MTLLALRRSGITIYSWGFASIVGSNCCLNLLQCYFIVKIYICICVHLYSELTIPWNSIQPHFLKNNTCTGFLYSLFNYCFKLGLVPDAWLKSIIQPIPKTDSKSIHPVEYRGISLQYVVAKPYCRVMNTRLRDYIECGNILSEEQNGFRPNRSCQDSIFTLESLLENQLRSKRTLACLINLRKAFGCINRDLLWQKLKQRYRIGGHFLAALKSLYKRVDCAVNINHSLSNWF